jgi:hypothetical protein
MPEFGPFRNWSTFAVLDWHYNLSVTKSARDTQTLIDTVLTDPRFDRADIVGLNVNQGIKLLDTYHAPTPFIASPTNPAPATTFKPLRPPNAKDDWQCIDVSIRLPQQDVNHGVEANAPTLTVKGIFVRDLLCIVEAAVQEPSFLDWHLKGFKHLYQPFQDSENGGERIYCEAWSSD